MQAELIETNKGRIGSSVLYVPKFFDRRGNIADFVTAVSPKHIVTNSGLQNSNIPHCSRGIVDYAKKTPNVFQTDTQGGITDFTNGKQIRVRTFLN
jgi:beta-lactamase superfamily II metal-dependent hydrolase